MRHDHSLHMSGSLRQSSERLISVKKENLQLANVAPSWPHGKVVSGATKAFAGETMFLVYKSASRSACRAKESACPRSGSEPVLSTAEFL